jgi:hypothetical protein
MIHLKKGGFRGFAGGFGVDDAADVGKVSV